METVLKLETFKLAKSLGLTNKIAYEWTKEAFTSNCESNEFKVAESEGINIVLLSRIVTASYQKTDSGESMLIAYLKNQVSLKDFRKWYAKYYKVFLKGLRSNKKWSLTGKVSHPLTKKTGKFSLSYGATHIYKSMRIEKERQVKIDALGGVEKYNAWLLENNSHVHPMFLKFA